MLIFTNKLAGNIQSHSRMHKNKKITKKHTSHQWSEKKYRNAETVFLPQPAPKLQTISRDKISVDIYTFPGVRG